METMTTWMKRWSEAGLGRLTELQPAIGGAGVLLEKEQTTPEYYPMLEGDRGRVQSEDTASRLMSMSSRETLNCAGLPRRGCQNGVRLPVIAGATTWIVAEIPSARSPVTELLLPARRPRGAQARCSVCIPFHPWFKSRSSCANAAVKSDDLSTAASPGQRGALGDRP